MGRIDGAVALVTGAASGIGAACVARFAEEGAMIAGVDLSPPAGPAWDRAAKTAKTAKTAAALACDVRDEQSVERMVAVVVEQFGRIDIVVNAAGVAGGGSVHMLPAEEWDRIVDTNLKGTFFVCKHAISRMLEQGSGNVINIASIEGLEGTEGGSAYNASKGGVVLLTKNLAIDYGRKNIRVNCICPGFIDTPMTASVFSAPGMGEYLERFRDAHQLGRVGKPEEIAAAALFLASADASFVSGHALVVDGGFTAGRRMGFAKMMGLE
jgi:NAD(P)-dependent dehydrogenase (short-subunit alcohol dehydrogenase family)